MPFSLSYGGGRAAPDLVSGPVDQCTVVQRA